jgi:flagellar assembly factor FliW
MSAGTTAVTNRDMPRIQSDLLGPLEIEPADVVHFAEGLFGFPDSRDYVLLPTERPGLYWLQSAEHSALAFLLVDPFPLFDGYAVDIGEADLRQLGGAAEADLIVLAIVTLPRDPAERPTANLQGPLAIDLRLRTAKQLAVGESAFGVRCPFDLSSSPG